MIQFVSLLTVLSLVIFSQSKVIKVTPQNSKQLFDGSRTIPVVFFAPWCGHCKKLQPEWKKAGSDLKGIVDLAVCDCTDSSLQRICSENGVEGYPTIKIFGSRRQDTPVTYQGPRSQKDIVDAAWKHLKLDIDVIEQLSDVDTTGNHIIVRTSKAKKPMRFIAPIVYQHPNVDTHVILNDSAGVTLIKDGVTIDYEQELKHKPLLAWLKKQL
eukprot:gnl/Dysnectes_brevis/2375_a2806_1430.p1 GENE.gnl/Dysnectes_brevis/2375_a2806_1430~~gnl/Dysnectes_brevis/2375_a2806_1430.p1  ORF type:complete len:212 (-),score=44.94 gnl/Dysnectes_brevis/2375_a2806_1430:55-690(-)